MICRVLDSEFLVRLGRSRPRCLVSVMSLVISRVNGIMVMVPKGWAGLRVLMQVCTIPREMIIRISVSGIGGDGAFLAVKRIHTI
ncbi:hypothetical protein ASPVEDRAFT_858877 [Aspergillus versicolor CBS 583.65]|uniref:Uncharacterized protein n=1 Tax=Aspergillus versicolor CBS 583.65 TaxID=1036611 RepID=A0A1L9PVH9_ASPVE|nr:uncharacterized protein ASPVEDRAFT_858877 [Aspergillus versicolor CBS 583.65]OJJ05521.1 hypothetical protein ASPVEDRAFT_858877 [Aspergillus versicolor CBS 583.65]